MKKIVLLTSIIVSVFLSQAQNTGELDKKNGINKFKLGSSYELYKKDLIYSLTQRGCKLYKYKGTDISILLGIMPDEIVLFFYKDKLFNISIYINDLIDPDGIDIKRRLTSLFGHPNKVYMDNYEWAYRWTGERVILGYDKVSCSSDYKPCMHMVWVTSQSIQREIDGDSF